MWQLRKAFSQCCYVLDSADVQQIAQKYSSCGAYGSQNWEEMDISAEMENVTDFRSKSVGKNKVQIMLKRIMLLNNNRQ